MKYEIGDIVKLQNSGYYFDGEIVEIFKISDSGNLYWFKYKTGNKYTDLNAFEHQLILMNDPFHILRYNIKNGL